jgi:hydrogenase maturation protease
MAEIAVVGIGNVVHGDDGIGAHVVRHLAAAGRAGATELYECGMRPFDILGVLLEHPTVVIVDRVVRGSRPGTLHRLDAAELDPLSEGLRFSDGLGVPDVVRVAREMGCENRVVVLGLEPGDITPALGLSPEVSEAMPRLVASVEREVGVAVFARATPRSARRRHGALRTDRVSLSA